MIRFPERGALLLGCALVCATPLAVSAQQQSVPDTATLRRQIQSKLGSDVSQAEIMDRLRQSGMTKAQARARLQQMGYDPSLADQYFDAIERGGEPPRGQASQSFLNALQRAGILALPRADSLYTDSSGTRRDTTKLARDSLAADTLRKGELAIFGRSLFSRATSQFQPIASGPVDASYRVGPGDEIILVITGDVELAYNLPVAREGYIVIPDVGQIFVNGLSLGQLEERLYDRLGRVYSGVRRGSGATTKFQISLGRLRTNQVFLVGEVVRPGAYQVSSLASVFNALYSAGGPGVQGSFRQIEVRRGGQIVRKVDLYRYLLRGDNSDDIRLEQGDIVFVPVAGRRVRVQGAVRRPAIYELADKDGLREVLDAAGGFEATAFARRVQIDRILPPVNRRPGVERVLIDVDVQALASNDQVTPLQDGDVIQVFAVDAERRHRLVVVGEVRRPGIYEWAPGMTLSALIQRAQGLDEAAYTPRAHIFRLNGDDGSRTLVRATLSTDSTRAPEVPLADRDSIVVFSRQRLTNAELVQIDGFVKKPGTYELADGMTLEDLVLAAGGFIRGAYTFEAELARQPNDMHRTDTTAIVVRIPLTSAQTTDGTSFRPPGSDGVAGRAARSDVPHWLPAPNEIALHHGDRVFIRKAPGYELPRSVKVTGQVLLPGTYVLQVRQERLSEVLARAGSLTKEAYLPGFQLFRRGTIMATDVVRALKQPDSRYNIALEPGDSLNVPAYDPTVLVTGAVAFESRVLYRPSASLDYYIAQAGGFGDRADKGRVSVSYQDGQRAISHRVLWFDSNPKPGPGSTVFVPSKPDNRSGPNWGAIISSSLAFVTSTATLLIAIRQLRN